MDHPPLHTLVFGESGSGKSTFAATFPKPMLVFHFDPFGKDTPYLRAGQAEELAVDDGIPARRIVSPKTGELRARIEYYHDLDPKRANAYERFVKRMADFHHHMDEWATVVIDSVTFMELACRKWHQYVLNPTAREPRQWYAGATESLEETLMQRFGAMPLNVVVIAHVDTDKDEVHGSFVRNPAAPGRLRTRLASAFGEFYHAMVLRQDDGTMVHRLQTRGDHLYPAASQIAAPNPSVPHYQALWAGEEGTS